MQHTNKGLPLALGEVVANRVLTAVVVDVLSYGGKDEEGGREQTGDLRVYIDW
jgi:hypothetical protein